MKNENYSRRKFIRNTVGAGLTISGAGILSSWSGFQDPNPFARYDAKGLPTAMLGKTGVRIPRIAIGLGSRFCNIETADESYKLLNFALDNGLYYWDTASVYVNAKLGITSEKLLSEVVKTRRNEIFLSTKVSSRDPNEAMRQIETSLKRLQTDQLDMLKIHDVQSDKDIVKISEKGNLIDIVHRMKEQGVTRFIGFSGHSEAGAMRSMAERGDFDSMLIAMNHWGGNTQKRQELAISMAKAKGMGVMLMKVVRPRETINEIAATDLVQYALSLKEPDGIVLGMESMAVVASNLEILRNFKPMDESRMNELALQLTPFYNHENLPWMQPGYCDGYRV